jgi:hypothetical protein
LNDRTWGALQFAAKLSVWFEALYHGQQCETPLEHGVDDRENEFHSEVFSPFFHWEITVVGTEVHLFASPLDSTSGRLHVASFDPTDQLNLPKARAIISSFDLSPGRPGSSFTS